MSWERLDNSYETGLNEGGFAASSELSAAAYQEDKKDQEQPQPAERTDPNDPLAPNKDVKEPPKPTAPSPAPIVKEVVPEGRWPGQENTPRSAQEKQQRAAKTPQGKVQDNFATYLSQPAPNEMRLAEEPNQRLNAIEKGTTAAVTGVVGGAGLWGLKQSTDKAFPEGSTPPKWVKAFRAYLSNDKALVDATANFNAAYKVRLNQETVIRSADHVVKVHNTTVSKLIKESTGDARTFLSDVTKWSKVVDIDNAVSGGVLSTQQGAVLKDFLQAQENLTNASAAKDSLLAAEETAKKALDVARAKAQQTQSLSAASKYGLGRGLAIGFGVEGLQCTANFACKFFNYEQPQKTGLGGSAVKHVALPYLLLQESGQVASGAPTGIMKFLLRPEKAKKVAGAAGVIAAGCVIDHYAGGSTVFESNLPGTLATTLAALAPVQDKRIKLALLAAGWLVNLGTNVVSSSDKEKLTSLENSTQEAVTQVGKKQTARAFSDVIAKGQNLAAASPSHLFYALSEKYKACGLAGGQKMEDWQHVFAQSGGDVQATIWELAALECAQAQYILKTGGRPFVNEARTASRYPSLENYDLGGTAAYFLQQATVQLALAEGQLPSGNEKQIAQLKKAQEYVAEKLQLIYGQHKIAGEDGVFMSLKKCLSKSVTSLDAPLNLLQNNLAELEAGVQALKRGGQQLAPSDKPYLGKLYQDLALLCLAKADFKVTDVHNAGRQRPDVAGASTMFKLADYCLDQAALYLENPGDLKQLNGVADKVVAKIPGTSRGTYKQVSKK